MNGLEHFMLNMVYHKRNFVVNFDAKGAYRYHRVCDKLLGEKLLSKQKISREQYIYRITKQGIDKMEAMK